MFFCFCFCFLFCFLFFNFQYIFCQTGFDQFETSMFHFDDLPKVPKDRKIITFRVRAAADAHIALISDKEDKDNMYEICKYKIMNKA